MSVSISISRFLRPQILLYNDLRLFEGRAMAEEFYAVRRHGDGGEGGGDKRKGVRERRLTSKGRGNAEGTL